MQIRSACTPKKGIMEQSTESEENPGRQSVFIAFGVFFMNDKICTLSLCDIPLPVGESGF